MGPVKPRPVAWSLTAALVLAAPLAPLTSNAADTVATDVTPLRFLVGHWKSNSGRDQDGQALHGEFAFEPVGGGKGLLRRDRTDMLDGAGHVVRSFDQVMLIYPEGGHVRADYFDGSHTIHYTDAIVDPGRSVRFVTAPGASGPSFVLVYQMPTGSKLTTKFEMAPPGQQTMHVVAEASRSGNRRGADAGATPRPAHAGVGSVLAV